MKRLLLSSIVALLCWLCPQAGLSQGSVADFNTTPSPACATPAGCMSFTQNLSGVTFVFTLTTSDAGGSFQFLPANGGVGGSGSMDILSGIVPNTATTEKVTIERQDGLDFNFNSIYLQNNLAQTTTVQGYNNGGTAGASQSVALGVTSTLDFSGLSVDKIELTSTDFFYISFDNFSICLPPVAAFTVNTVCQGIATSFTDASTSVAGDATYAWDFDNDGTTESSTKGDVSYTYATAGVYTAKLTITQNGCSNSTTRQVIVRESSAPPVITSTLCISSTTVAGTSTGANGTVITLYKGGSTPIATTTVNGGAWSVPVSGLTNGDVITAKSTESGKCESIASNPVTVADNLPPVISNCPPAQIIIQTGAGNIACSKAVTWTEPTASDACDGVVPVFSQTHTSGSTFNVGTTTVTYIFKDASGNTTPCSFDVIVQDNTIPILTCPDPVSVIESSPGSGSAVVNYADATAGDNCPGIGVIQYSVPSGSTFPLGTTTVNVSVMDAAGNPASCSFTVTVTQACQLGATIPDANAYSTGALANTVYIGWLPASNITYSASITNGQPNYTYNWSASTGLSIVGANNGETVQVTSVSPGSYLLTLALTDANGCQTTATKTINVIDIRCGKKLDKVMVCQKPDKPNGNNSSNCAAPNAVANLLAGGATLGECTVSPSTTRTKPSTVEPEIIQQMLSIKALPNPSPGYFTIEARGIPEEKLWLRVYDLYGRTIESRSLAGQTVFKLGENYKPGTYLVEVQQGLTRQQLKIIKL